MNVLFIYNLLLWNFFSLYASKNSKTGLTFSLNHFSGPFKDTLWEKDITRRLNLSPIFGTSSSLNYYYVNIYIGPPSQKQAMIIDTGSHLTAVPCIPLCTHCGKHINSFYQLNASLASNVLNCDY